MATASGPGNWPDSLEAACSNFSSAIETLKDCKSALNAQLCQHEAGGESPRQVSLARIFWVGQLSDAVTVLREEVALRLAKNIQLTGRKSGAEKFLIPIVDSIIRESSFIFELSKGMSAARESELKLEENVNLMRESLQRCLDSFEPVRRVLLSQSQRGCMADHGEVIDNRTLDSLSHLHIAWDDVINRAQAALPVKVRVAVMVKPDPDKKAEADLNHNTTDIKKYWPV